MNSAIEQKLLGEEGLANFANQKRPSKEVNFET